MELEKTKLEESFQRILQATTESNKYWEDLLSQWSSKISSHEQQVNILTDKIEKKKSELKDLERTHLERKSKLDNELLRIKENFEQTHEKLVNKFSFEKIIKLNVGGKIFTTRLDTIVNSWCKDNFLSALFSGSFLPETDSNGNYFIDRNGDIFHHILNILRDQSYLAIISQLSKIEKQQLIIECQFFGIESLLTKSETEEYRNKKNLVGKRIKVWWFSEKKWYKGKITSSKKTPLCKRTQYEISYDDGDVRNYYLDEKRYELLDDNE